MSLKRNFASGLVALLVCWLVFCISLISVFAIPAKMLKRNAAASGETLLIEGDSPHVFGGREDWRLDNYTTSIMLNTASADSPNPVNAALLDYSWNKKESTIKVESFVDSIGRKFGKQGGGEWESYWRYWHGYVIVIRPLLLIMDINGIRTLFLALFSAILLITCWLFSKLSNPLVGLMYALGFVAVNSFVAITSIPFAFSFFIGVCGVLFVQLHQDGKWSLSGKVSDFLVRWATFFLVVGALTVFFDFLDNPIITLGLPLATLSFLNRNKVAGMHLPSWLGLFIVLCGCWVLGYAATWIVKWILSSVVTGENCVAAALMQVQYRSGTESAPSEGGAGFSRMGVMLKNLHVLLPSIKVSLCICLLTVLIVCYLFCRFQISYPTRWLFPAMLVFLLPYIWYLGVSNHSFVHYWFSYRNQLVSISVVFLLFGDCIWKLKEFLNNCKKNR